MFKSFQRGWKAEIKANFYRKLITTKDIKIDCENVRLDRMWRWVIQFQGWFLCWAHFSDLRVRQFSEGSFTTSIFSHPSICLPRYTHSWDPWNMLMCKKRFKRYVKKYTPMLCKFSSSTRETWSLFQWQNFLFYLPWLLPIIHLWFQSFILFFYWANTNVKFADGVRFSFLRLHHGTHGTVKTIRIPCVSSSA